MGYVGNQDTEGFSSIPAKQDLTGATGTSLTLTHPVSSAESIDLFINNVRQEPTTAYSVSGTTVTLTGSVVATDDIYVVYNGLALQTTVPPDGSVTSAKLDTNIAVTGDLTVDTSTLHVDSTNNRVGIGTSSPSYKIDVKSVGEADIRIDSATGNDGALRFAENGTNVFTMYHDAANSALAFYDNANTSERMRIDSSGRLLVGGTTAIDTSTINVYASSSNSTISTKPTSNVTYDGMTFRNFAGTYVGYISVTASSTAYNTSSDYRLKENVTDITGATDRLKQLNPVRFNFIADADTTVDGFLAHEVQGVVPEAITGTHNEVDDDGNPVYQGIDQSKLVPLLVATIQELEARIAALESA